MPTTQGDGSSRGQNVKDD